jgi:hypothetical protein
MTSPEPSVHERLRRGEIVEVGGKLYAYCPECKKLVRVDKPFLGSLHLCD